jgi:hypothetical protein
MTWRAALAIALLSCTLPALSEAEIQVNRFTVGDQAYPAVASDAEGKFVVVWRDNGRDGSGDGVFGGRFDGSGSAIGTSQVNTYTPGGQGLPDVAASADGQFTVAWNSVQDHDNYGIFARHYSSSGAPLTPEFAINSYTRGFQIRPHVARANDGTFLVVFDDQRPLAGSFDVRAYLDTAPSGSPDLVDALVNTTTAGNQLDAKVSISDGGQAWMVWTSVGQDGSGDGVFAKTFSGPPIPPTDIQVNTTTANSQNGPVVAAFGPAGPGGGAIVAWNSLNQDGFSNGVFAQRFDDTATPVGTEFQVNSYTLQQQSGASVVADAQGNFVIAWESFSQDGSISGVFAQRFDSDGARFGSEFQVNTYTIGAQGAPDVAMDGDGNFVIAWESSGQDGDGTGIFARRFLPVEAGGTKSAVSGFLTTSVTTPNAGIITVEPGDAAPNDLTVVGTSGVHITAPPATAANPLVLTFTLDGATLCWFGSFCSPGELPFYLEFFSKVYRNGVPVPDCTGAPGVAAPDPCVTSRVVELDYDIVVTVLTSSASEWLVALPNGHCPATADPGCVTGFAKGSLLVKQDDIDKQKLIAKLIGGPALAQTDLGNPLAPIYDGTGTVVALCVYDDGGDLAGELYVPRAGDLCGANVCWSPIGNPPNDPGGAGSGYKYKDANRGSSGVKSINYRGGAAGKSKAIVKASGAGLPPGMSAALEGSTQATVQLRAVDGQCLSVTLSDVKSNGAGVFKAK